MLGSSGSKLQWRKFPLISGELSAVKPSGFVVLGSSKDQRGQVSLQVVPFDAQRKGWQQWWQEGGSWCHPLQGGSVGHLPLLPPPGMPLVWINQWKKGLAMIFSEDKNLHVQGQSIFGDRSAEEISFWEIIFLPCFPDLSG